ncbi:MAG: hypothetical protein Q9204_001255 [Flavoplaca sp. TL-2023a]
MAPAIVHPISVGFPDTKQLPPKHASSTLDESEPVINHGTNHGTAQGDVYMESTGSGLESNNPIGQSDDDGAIAVIGMAVKFPGDATSPESFWQMLVNRQSAMSEVPKDRFNIDAFYNHSGNYEPGTMNARGGHFIMEDLQVFDAPFFSISPAEAECLDPQQRWLLETTYHALENAGLSLEDVASSSTAVHVGSFIRDYASMLSQDPDLHAQHRATVVAGSNIMFNPESSAALADLGFLSSDSKCYSFDERANGYARGEGIAVIIVKSIAKALQDGDTIRAVIRATRSNQDGRTPSIAQPNSKAHEALIRQTYHSAGLDVGFTDFFEAHGTGTPVGDPTEARGIHQAFKDRSRLYPLHVGAVKSNIGHLEGSSGLAGLIKAALAVEKAIIPPNAWFEKLNKSIDSMEWNLKFPNKPADWPRDGLRRASVNSFGFGGSNCHVVVEDAFNYLQNRGIQGRHCSKAASSQGSKGRPDYSSPLSDTEATTMPRLLVWSAQDEKGLGRMRAVYQDHLTKTRDVLDEAQLLADLNFTLSSKRSRLPWKAFSIANSLLDLTKCLSRDFAQQTRSTREPRIIFVFTGQGTEWIGMGLELLGYTVIKESIKASQGYLQDLGCTWQLVDEIQKAETASNIHNPAYSQPLCTALQIALLSLLCYWGVKPESVVGHSSGEIAAAYCAGAISHAAAIKIAYHRGRLAASIIETGSPPGAMLAVGLSEADVSPYIIRTGPDKELTIACVNSAQNVTIAGPEHLVQALGTLLDTDGVFNRKLKVKVAYHSAAMQSLAIAYRSAIQDIAPGSSVFGSPRMVSSSTGSESSINELQNPGYWVHNLVSTVRFSSAIRQLASSNADLICEIGPHGALRGPIVEDLKDMGSSKSVTYLSLLARGHSPKITALEAAGVLYCHGSSLNIMKTNIDFAGNDRVNMLTTLPNYPFERSKKYWNEGRTSKNIRFRKAPPHELLGTAVSDWNRYEARWTNHIDRTKSPWVDDHKINETVLYPATGFIIMAIEAARQLAIPLRKICQYHLRDVTYGKAVVIPRNGRVEVQMTLRQTADGGRNFLKWSEFHIYTYEGQDATEAGRGLVAVEYEGDDPVNDLENFKEHDTELPSTRYDELAAVCKATVPSKQLYETLDASGSAIASMDALPWTSRISSTLQPDTIHPGALDALLQIALVVLTKGGTSTMSTMVPTQIARLRITSELYECRRPGIRASADLQSKGGRSAKFSIAAFSNDTSKELFDCSLEAKVILDPSESYIPDLRSVKRLAYHLDWRPDIAMMTKEAIENYCFTSSNFYLDMDKAMNPEKDLLCRLVLGYITKSIDEQAVRRRKPHFERYMDWIHHQNLPDTPSPPGSSDDQKVEIEKLESKVENVDVLGRLLVLVTRNLRVILEGQIDALQLLFEDDLLTKFYAYINQKATSFQRLALYLDLLAHKKPNLKILEVGAGTGSATRDVLSVLSKGGYNRFQHYVFTDISPSFFEKAKQDFQFYADRMTFLPLNIEQDPLQQGFDGSYDVVIASNALHATADLAKTLQNARKLLKRDGKIIIFEKTNPDLLTAGLIFGLLPGWWLGTEAVRKWGPLVTEETWHNLLQQNGFSGVEISFRDYVGDGRPESSIMIATATDQSTATFLGPQIMLLEDQTLNDSGTQSPTNPIVELLHRRMQASNIESQILLDATAIKDSRRKIAYVIYSNPASKGLLDLTEIGYANLQKLTDSAAGILWTFTSPGTMGSYNFSDSLPGFQRSVLSEHGSIKIGSLGISTAESDSVIVERIVTAFQHQFRDQVREVESDYMLNSALIEVPRLVEAKEVNHFVHSRTTTGKAEPNAWAHTSERCLKLDIPKPGLLESLQFIDDLPASRPIAMDEIEVEVKAVGLIFRDLLIALGQYPSDEIGKDCAGVITRAGRGTNFKIGERVVCVADAAFQTRARCKGVLACTIADHLSFSAAAAIPCSFITAWCSLVEVARIKPQESVLIHSAAGGTGQACIQIAQLHGAEVYATVGTERKREFLQETYGIPKRHIFTSRSSAFASGISAMTNGRGVDVIVNSLAGEALRSTWEDCLAPFGRFVEIGKKDIQSLGYLSMSPFSKNVTFASVDLALYCDQLPGTVGRWLETLMKLLGEGKIHVQKPLAIFDASQIQEAFRLMQGGKTMGKSVITFSDLDMVPTVPSSLPKYYFDANATYIIAGGLGGLGRSIARWMVSRKARYLILLGSSNPIREAGKVLVDELEAQGVFVATPSCDISEKDTLDRTLNTCLKNMPPIRGCVQAAMTLRDQVFVKTPYTDFQAVLKPKVQGSWNLHSILPQKMDFFVLLSSLAALFGNHGQSAYAAACTFQDAFARHRVAQGERAVSINLGRIGDVGYAAESEKLASTSRTDAYLNINEKQFLAIMEYACDPELELNEGNCQIVTGLKTPGMLRRDKIEAPWFMDRPMFSHLYAMDDASISPNTQVSGTPDDEIDLPSLLLSPTGTAEEGAAAVTSALKAKLATMMALQATDVDELRPLHSYGVDSLAAVEIRTWFARRCRSDVTVFEVMGNSSLGEMGQLAVARSGFVKERKGAGVEG